MPTWRSQTLLIPGKGRGLPIPGNNLVGGVGDSLTVASANTGGADYDSAYRLRTVNPTGLVGGYLAWATILPKTGDSVATGKMRFAGVHATGGLTTAQVKTTHIDGSDSPLNDSPKPGMVAVLTGTNDLGTVSPGGVLDTAALATWKASLKSIYNRLIANNILPVACKLPPNGVANNQPAVTAMNTEVGNLATELGGLPLADLFTPCATGNNWTTGYNVDNDHPTVTGARAMGQALRNAVDAKLPSTTPNLVTSATRAAAGIVFLGGDCANLDSNGVPQGGYTTEAAGYWTQTANGCTWSLVSDGGYSGQAWRWNKTTDPGDSQCQGTGAGAPATPQLTSGHLYEVGFTAQVDAWATGIATQCTFDIWQVTDASNNPFSVTIRRDTGFSSAVSRFVLFHTFRASATGGYRFNISAGGGDASNLIDFRLGQITLRDLGVG